jgi:hypothetical protein
MKFRNNDSPTHTYVDINVYTFPKNNSNKSAIDLLRTTFVVNFRFTSKSVLHVNYFGFNFRLRIFQFFSSEFAQPILWYPEDLSASPNSDEYYHAYSVQHTIGVVHQSIRLAFSNLYENCLYDNMESIKTQFHRILYLHFFKALDRENGY